jgi:pimeloyl-ACP methyl ester carboxylesterase
MRQSFFSDGRFLRFSLILQAILILRAPLPAHAAGPATRPYVVHLPGVGGILTVDHNLIAGLKAGGVKADYLTYDWTEHDPGVPALHAIERNHKEAQRVADLIAQRAEAYPGSRVVLTSHSGGGAMAVWTLERLPVGVQVDDALLMAPALSPGYDLSKALSHVKGKMYVFWSTGDELVLGLGCRLCGTMDGILTDAAGKVSFSQPAGANVVEYQKLHQIAYDPAWMRLGNFGDHVGPMSGPFAAVVLAPLVSGTVPLP